MNAKTAELRAAKAAGDSAKAGELGKWGSAHQERAHRQLMGEAPVDDIVAALGSAFSDAAKISGVSAIAVDLPFADPDVKKVDITDLLLDCLQADARTREIIGNRPAALVK